MPVAVTVKVEGLAEISRALQNLPKATATRVQRRVLTEHAKPTLEAAKAKVSVYRGDLRDSLQITSKRPRGYKTDAARAFAKAGGGQAGKAAAKAAGATPVSVFIVAGRLPQPHMLEFGTVNMPAEPYFRPAWDANKGAIVRDVGRDLWVEINRAAARSAKRKK